MALIDSVKAALRVDGTASDIELSDLIVACKADLAQGGADPTLLLDTDALVTMTVIQYCKAHFDADERQTPRHLAIYEGLKTVMGLSADYRLEDTE